MSTLDDIRTIRRTALRLLPGFWQARTQLDLAIEVLEYFAREAEHEMTTGQFRTHSINPEIARQICVLQALISAFMRLHQPRS